MAIVAEAWPPGIGTTTGRCWTRFEFYAESAAGTTKIDPDPAYWQISDGAGCYPYSAIGSDPLIGNSLTGRNQTRPSCCRTSNTPAHGGREKFQRLGSISGGLDKDLGLKLPHQNIPTCSSNHMQSSLFVLSYFLLCIMAILEKPLFSPFNLIELNLH